MSGRAKDFWAGMNNISKITKMIIKKREQSAYHNTIVQPEISNKSAILDLTKTRDQNLFQLKNVLVNTNLFELFAYIFSDMYRYNFSQVSSLDTDVHKNLYDESELNLLQEVDLMSHSCNMFNQMYLYMQNKRTYGAFVDYFLLFALVHDFGKSKALQESFELSLEVGHHENSAQYLEERILDTGKRFTPGESEALRLVINAIRVHHDDVLVSIETVPSEADEKNNNIQENELQKIILQFFKVVHTAQREIEFKI